MKSLLILGAAFALTTVVRADWPVLRSYEGEFLRRVKMPLGGIGTGTVSLSGCGALVDWEIRSRPAKGFTPTSAVAPGFVLRTETADGKVAARLLEGPVDTETYEAAEGSNGFNHGFPRFRDCRFDAAYPLAQVRLSDAAMPVLATLEAMNPLVPGDPEASGIPAALLRWRLTNREKDSVKISLCGFMVFPGAGACRRSFADRDGLCGIRLASEDLSSPDDTHGEIAFVVPGNAGEVSRTVAIADTNWMVKFDPFWRRFVSSGLAEDTPDEEKRGCRPMGAVSVSLTLTPGETAIVPFALAWRFPHRVAWSAPGQAQAGAFKSEDDVGNHYAAVYATATDAAARLMSDLARLERETVSFVADIVRAPVPAVIREAALFNLSTLRSTTCFRTADGHFFGWEGSYDARGSCYGSCSHVWGYEHALIDLWPSLAKDMTELQFGPASDERGRMSFRIGLPLDRKARSTIDAADGHLQCIVKAYENWRKTRDDDWMRRLFPRLRQAVAFCWTPGGWDGDADGVMEGCQHNTMDVEYYGPNPQMEFLYLAALKAAAEMADAAGDGAFAAKCRELAVRGSAWTEANLFNGAYYEHHVRPPRGPVADGISTGCAKNLDDPDYQLAAGCLVDQLLGDVTARAVGLGPVADEAHAAASLDAVLMHNRKDDSVYNHMRIYAFPEERSLTMAWYPEGRLPRHPFPYCHETMTGFEYVVAAALAQRGRLREAEEVVRDIRARYDGRKRNPFDEAECGHHYVRALASWTVFKSWR